MSWFRLNALAVGSLTTTILLGVTTFYLLSLKHKGRETLYLSGYLGSLFVLLLAYTVRYSVFSAAALATGQVANLIVFGVASLIQFAYWFGGNPNRTESRIVLAATLTLAFAAWGTLAVSGRHEALYDFRAEYFTYAFDPRVSILALAEYIWALVVFVRKIGATDERAQSGIVPFVRRVIRPAGKIAASHRSFALLTLVTIPIALQFALLHTRLISRGTYALLFNTGSLLICLLIFNVYINNSPRPTSFLAKLIGIPLAVVMVAFGIASNAVMPIVERTIMARYRADAELARLAIETRSYSRLPDDVKYVVSSTGTGGTVRYLLPAAEDTVSTILDSIGKGLLPFTNPGTSIPVFHYLDLYNTGTFYFSYPVAYQDSAYWVGFSYAAYRLAVHEFALKLASAVSLAWLVVLVGFPLLFRRGLIRPLQELLHAVARVSEGDFRHTVPVVAEDEIGQLARGHNRMIESLRTMEGNFKALAENAYDAILIVSQNGEILFANERTAQLSGMTADRLREQHLRSFIPEYDVSRLTRNALEKARGNSVPESYETQARRMDGAAIPIEITAAPTLWQKTPADVVIVRDISDRRRAAELLRTHQQELMRTDKLSSLGELVAGVAHEINNPNHVVAMNVRFLQEGVPLLLSLTESSGEMDATVRIAGKPYHEFKTACDAALFDIERSAKRIDHIVGELNRFVREKNPVLESVDINLVVQGVVDLSRQFIDKSTTQFHLELWETPLTVKGDFVACEQVVLNLIENAGLALRATNGALRVSTSMEADGNNVCIVVADEGVGIPAEDLARITEPFFTTRAENGGTGLGLSVTDRILRSFGGSMTFESTVGRGTTVTVRLPASENSL